MIAGAVCVVVAAAAVSKHGLKFRVNRWPTGCVTSTLMLTLRLSSSIWALKTRRAGSRAARERSGGKAPCR